MASIIAYLENYVESTIGLPSDLARFLNMIRVLDERATELEAALRQTTEALCSLNPVGTRPQAPENKVGSIWQQPVQGGRVVRSCIIILNPQLADISQAGR